MDLARSQSEKQYTLSSRAISPNSRHAKRNSRRVRRSTSEKPRSMFKQTKKEYDHAMTLPLIPAESGKRKGHPLRGKKHLTFGSEIKDSHPQHIQNTLVWKKLIEFTSQNPSIEFLISSSLTAGWHSPKKQTESVYRSKIESHITCASLPQCLNYTFEEYMEYEWAQHIYIALIMQLTLAQKALLFFIGSNRRNRKKTLVSTIKDCIIGEEGVQWIMYHLMAKTRQEAVTLAQNMMDARYINACNTNNTFEDNDSLYQFDEDAIHDNISPITPQTPISPTVQRFYRHNEWIQCLVKMNDAQNGKCVEDIKCAFYVPCTRNNNRYICKNIDYVAFDLWNEVIEFILTQFWEERFAQNIYNFLIVSLSVSQKCKLMSIGMETKTRKWRLKKYKSCFIGSLGIKWLILSRFVSDTSSALNLANRFRNKGLIKHIMDVTAPFKNSDNAFYVFDLSEIAKQSCDLLCVPPVVSRFSRHETWIQNLISMTMTPLAEIELLLDLSVAFYLPRLKDKHCKFVSKFDSNIAFENVIEALHFILMEKWEKDYSQIVYRKLLSKLSLSQKAKLLSHGIERKTKKKHFKKYKDCIVGNESCLWMVNCGFCSDIMEAIELGNTFLNCGFIKQVHNEYLFKNDGTFYQFDDVEINKQCIMESYKSYVNISPYNISESNAHSFPDIDYDVNNGSKVLSFDYEKEKEEYKKQDKEEPSFPDISSFQIQRTPPIKISKSKSKSSHSKHENLVYGAERIQRHHEMNNLSVYSNVAVHGRNSPSDTNLGDLVLMDINDDTFIDIPKPIFSIMESITNDTPEPHVDFGIDSEYFVSTTPVDTPSDEHKHDPMATRITVPIFDEFALHDTDNLDGIIYAQDKEGSTSSKSLSRYRRNDTVFQFGHHIINSLASSDIPMDENIFGDDNTSHFTQISNSNSHNPFSASYNKYIPNQIGI